MESAGVLHAAHLSGELDALIVRGISDKADSRKTAADAAGSQPRAARNAAGAAVSDLRKALPSDTAPRRGFWSELRDAFNGSEASGDHIEIGPGATFRDAVVGKDVDGVEGQDHHPGTGDHIEIGKGGTFEGPVTGKRVGGR
jgi:hypothetical protein